jgi:protoporphyrinogen oxidase
MDTPGQHWAILGGGFLGMTLALRLAQQGKKVTLLEASPSLGGLASAWNLGEVVWDRHYHVTLQSDNYLRTLLKELGLESHIQWAETRTGFYTDCKLYSMSNTLEFLRFPPLGVLDKLRLGATIFYASKLRNWKRLEQITATEWLRRWSGEHTLNSIWLPLLRAKLGENYKKASAAFIWAIIARMYAARRAGMKKEMFGYVPGGYATVLEHLGRALVRCGVSVRLSEPVSAVESCSGRQVRVELKNGKREIFDQVILTMAAPLAASICRGLKREEMDRLLGIEYQGIICASLLLKEPLSPYYVTNITESWVPYTAVIEMSALVDRKHFAGHALIYLPKYIPSQATDFQLSDEVIREQFLTALEQMYPQFDRSQVVCLRISRVRYVLPISTIGYSDRLPPVSTTVAGVHILNSAHIVNGTLNVNETIQLAEKAAARFSSCTSSSVAEMQPDKLCSARA